MMNLNISKTSALTGAAMGIASLATSSILGSNSSLGVAGKCAAAFIWGIKVNAAEETGRSNYRSGTGQFYSHREMFLQTSAVLFGASLISWAAYGTDVPPFLAKAATNLATSYAVCFAVKNAIFPGVRIATTGVLSGICWIAGRVANLSRAAKETIEEKAFHYETAPTIFSTSFIKRS